MAHASATERLARLEEGVVRCLRMLEQGRIDETRRALEALTGGAVTPEASELTDGVTDQELDSAFAAAQPDLEQVVDADRVAQEAMREADRALALERGLEVAPAFETRTMADLLEQQGDAESATRIRARLEDSELERPAILQPERPTRQRVVSKLETWLVNLREQERR